VHPILITEDEKEEDGGAGENEFGDQFEKNV
jgi:hypothetical protein